MLDASYLYSKNNRREITDYYADGNLHQFISRSARFIANPRKRIGFFAVAGGSLLFNRVFGENSRQIAVNVGVGFEGHFPTSFGMLVPTAEWRIELPFSSVLERSLLCASGTATISKIYSIPRFTMYWYPNF